MAGKAFGFKSTTKRNWVLDGPYGYVALSLLCAISKQKCPLTAIKENEEQQQLTIYADIPSSAKAWGGTPLVDAIPQIGRYEVSGTATFHGQLIAWGKGNQMLRQLWQDSETFVTRFSIEHL